MRAHRKIIIILTIIAVVTGSYFAYESIQRRITMQLAKVALGSFANYLTLSFDTITFNDDRVVLTNAKIFDFKNYFLNRFISSVTADHVILKNIQTANDGLKTISVEAKNVRTLRPVTETVSLSPLKSFGLDALTPQQQDGGVDISFQFSLQNQTAFSFDDIHVKDSTKQTALLDVRKLTVNNSPLNENEGVNQHYLIQGVTVKGDQANTQNASFTVIQTTSKDITTFKDFVVSDASSQKQVAAGFSSLTIRLSPLFLDANRTKPTETLTAGYEAKDVQVDFNLLQTDNILKKLGYKKAAGNMKGQIDLDPNTGTAIIKTLTDIDDVAKLQAGAKFSGVDVETFLQNSTFAIPSMKLNFLLLQLDNKTLLQKYLAATAKEKESTPEQVKAELLTNLTTLVNGFDPAFQKETTENTQKFLDTGKMLKVTLNPQNPIDIPTLVLLYLTNYSAIPQTLGITVSSE